MKFNPYCSGSSRLEIIKKKIMKSSAGIPLPRGDNVLLKGPNDPKKLPKGPKKEQMGQI